ncbi:saccharopine dehydrogenase family protein [Oceanicoccus sagamiensis]|uniref:Saccharopine dehydrogenase n=1 Tax=Oceanicoccus sagamiensis TaxID=716816 RepID=A0A1X9NC13_9GAMM|nr:saccharopine dehydrogenase NADP-binding domain-containing protein [Oceanicoccus sagamiensis]ARN75570.1 saccharopine dehydrogenase [Oceanicoccus sagamiensis]
MSSPQYDVVIFGATSFVGQIIVRYFCEQFSTADAAEQVSWAIAGRSEAKLNEVKALMADKVDDIPTIVANADDLEAMRAMCEQTLVVMSTVGPYALYGDTLIQACVETGTDYCDLAGEIQWIKRMQDKYSEAALNSGARIVHSCGFDSIPSDMGVYYLQQQAKAKLGQVCSEVALRIKAASGGFSGGTFASMVNANDEMAADPELQALLEDSYAICPEDYPKQAKQHSILSHHYDENFASWSAPFMMAPINEPVVLRSNALSDYSYGKDFHYNEAILTAPGTGGKIAAVMVDKVMKIFVAATAMPLFKPLIMKIMPAPGEGPSPEAQAKGFYDIRFLGKTNDGQRIQTKLTGDRDPGYGSTAKIIAQSAVCLAKDISQQEKGGGFWTTATVFDQRLIDRLCQYAGLTFEVIDDD